MSIGIADAHIHVLVGPKDTPIVGIKKSAQLPTIYRDYIGVITG